MVAWVWVCVTAERQGAKAGQRSAGGGGVVWAWGLLANSKGERAEARSCGEWRRRDRAWLWRAPC
jgi:hypothetical protein